MPLARPPFRADLRARRLSLPVTRIALGLVLALACPAVAGAETAVWSLASDDPVIARGAVTLRFTIEAKNEGLAAGDTLDVLFPLCAPLPYTRWTTPQLESPDAAGWVSVNGAAHASVATFPSVTWCRDIEVKLVDRLPRVLVVVLREPLYAGQRIEVTYGDPGDDGAGRARAQLFPEREAPFRVGLRRAGGEGRVDLPRRGPALRVGRAGPHRLVLAGAADVVLGRTASFRVAALDSLGFPASSFPAGVSVRAVHESGTRVESLSLAAAADPCAREVGPVRLDALGLWWIEAEGPGVERAWSLPVVVGGSVARRLVWGDLHWHTRRSDGSRTPREGYEYARDVVGLDFTAKTDHDVHYIFPCMTESDWEESAALATEFTRDGEFVALLGWEWTYPGGHQNVYFRDAEGPYLPLSEYGSPEELWAALEPGTAMTVPHHPAGGKSVSRVKWDLLDPASPFLRIVELFSMHGNAEAPLSPHRPGKGIGMPRYDDPRVSTVQEAFAGGFPLGIIASTDVHAGTPGNPVRMFRKDLSVGAGLCAAWVGSLTREGVYDAIAAQDCYGTTGPRIRIEIGEDRGELDVRVAGTTTLTEVVLVGVVRGADLPLPELESLPVEGRVARARMPIDELPASVTHVYLRVTQADGEMGWSSPVPVGAP